MCTPPMTIIRSLLLSIMKARNRWIAEIITIDSDTEAHGVIALEGWARGPDRTTKLLRTRGHYHERYVFEDDAWRIAETKLVMLFTGPDT